MPDLDKILGYALLALMGIAGWMYRQLEARVSTVEGTRVNKADADAQRQELRKELAQFHGETRVQLETIRTDNNAKRVEAAQELRDIRDELNERLETLRTETNSKLEKLSDQISNLATAVGKRNPRK